MMVKYCLVCGIEIADTSYDTPGRFNAVKYCTECAIEQKKKANKRDRQKRKMRKAFEKETEEYEMTELAKACQTLRRLANQESGLLKQKINILNGELMQERAKKDPRTGGNQ